MEAVQKWENGEDWDGFQERLRDSGGGISGVGPRTRLTWRKL